MREKLQTLPLTELKAIAKAQGIKSVSVMRKAQLIDLLCEKAKELEEGKNASGDGNEKKEETRRASASDGRTDREPAAQSQPVTQPRQTAQSRPAAQPQQTAQSRSAAQPQQTAQSRPAAQPQQTAQSQPVTQPQPAAQSQPAVQPQPAAQSQISSQVAETPARPYASQRGDMPRRQENQDRPQRPAGKPVFSKSYGGYRSGEVGRSYGTRNENADSPRSYSPRNENADSPRGYSPRNENADSPRGYGSRNENAETPRGYSPRNESAETPRSYGSRNESIEVPRENSESIQRLQEDAGSDLPKVPASRITPQIQAQFPDQSPQDIAELDSGVEANGILEVMPDGFGFIRCENFLPGENDVYVAPSQIRRFNLKTGDILVGSRRVKTASEKFAALLYIKTVNGYPLSVLETRPSFEKLTPIFPNERLHMETPGRQNSTAMRVLDLLAPIGKGQRGMIVSPPKAGKTTLLKQVAQAITTNHPDMHLIILLIDERPEEVTDIKESVTGKNVEVIFSTFDELPERHKRVSEMVVERARRLVEHGRDVIILLDSITRLTRAYNIVVPPSGRTLSGGMDPAALHMPKRFFGAARNMREGGSLTILATALVNTGSRMDDVVYEEFKGTGNMELVLDRKLSEKRIFPAIDILKSGTRNDQLLLTREEQECVDMIRKATSGMKADDAVEQILNMFARTRNNREFMDMVRKTRIV